MNKHIPLTLIAILIGCSFLAKAQKLPNKQEASVYAPSDLKIDGTAKEWNDTYQAYNHATETWYTIFNDEGNLYFIFRANEIEVIQKIITGGITIAISSVDKKSNLKPVSMTYPVVPFMNSQVNYDLKPTPLSDNDVKLINSKINDHLKDIKITGVKSVPDSVVSIYNDLGIRGAHRVDNKKNYICEMALPLSYIKHLIDDKGTLAYRVQVTGIDLKTTIVVGGRSSSDPTPPSSEAAPHGLLYDTSPTYFSATYTLAKKP